MDLEPYIKYMKLHEIFFLRLVTLNRVPPYDRSRDSYLTRDRDLYPSPPLLLSNLAWSEGALPALIHHRGVLRGVHF